MHITMNTQSSAEMTLSAHQGHWSANATHGRAAVPKTALC
jgi:hypothetical protein